MLPAWVLSVNTRAVGCVHHDCAIGARTRLLAPAGQTCPTVAAPSGTAADPPETCAALTRRSKSASSESSPQSSVGGLPTPWPPPR
eukprot:597851-Prymnesium_polylepis.1